MKVEEKKIQSFSNKNEGSASYNCNDEYDLSIVCINNNDNILNQYLIPSVQKQLNVKYELLILDSCKNLYSGAREAFNGVLSDLKGQYVVFVHNDFCFEGSDAFQTILHYCKSLESFGVVGVAGCSFDAKKTILTRIKQGANKRSVGQLITEPVSVMSVDECCFIIKRNQIANTPFSEKRGWHLYAVEYCLQMLDCGLRNYVIPLEAWHYSDGISLNASYCKEIKFLLDKYQKKYSYINTTVRQWKTDFYTREIFLRYYAFKQYLKAKFIKK